MTTSIYTKEESKGKGFDALSLRSGLRFSSLARKKQKDHLMVVYLFMAESKGFEFAKLIIVLLC